MSQPRDPNWYFLYVN